jgi:uncharacterized protein (DUF433 family)
MTMPARTEYPHIVLNDQGIRVIEGTTMKVIELVAARHTYGWSPEELQLQYPSLTQSRIHAALAYYLGSCRRTGPRGGSASGRV